MMCKYKVEYNISALNRHGQNWWMHCQVSSVPHWTLWTPKLQWCHAGVSDQWE